MTVSVIIATMNRPADLQKALGSLLAQSLIPREVLIVDQSTDALTREVTERMAPRFAARLAELKYVYQEEKSLVRARNRGLALVKGDLISFLDDDIVLLEDYYRTLVAYLEAHPEVGAISGNTIVENKLKGPKWFLRRCLMRLFLLSNFDGRMTASGFGYPIFERQIDRVLDVEMLPGCNMHFKKKPIEGEKFDEWFTGYSYREDADFSYRISLKTRVRMIPEALLYHYQAPSNRLDFETLKKMQIKNYHHMFEKYKKKSAASEVLFAYSMAGLAVIDLLEFLTSGKGQKLNKFKAGVRAAFALGKKA